MLLLNFKNAFDKVPYQHLCYKLSHYRICGATLEWITSFLMDRTQKVIVNGHNSSSREVIRICMGPTRDSLWSIIVSLLY